MHSVRAMVLVFVFIVAANFLRIGGMSMFAGVFEVAALCLIIWMIGNFVIRTVRFVHGLRMLRTGRYCDAADLFLRLAGNAQSRFAQACRFNAAVALHRKGDLSEALEVLAKIDASKQTPTIRPHYFALFARTFVMQGRDFASADKHHEQALAELAPEMADIHLYQCYQACVKGDLASATAFREKYQALAKVRDTARNEKGKHVRMDWQYADLIDAYLLGFYFWKTGDLAQARAHLEKASQFPYPDLYSTRAKELLAQLPESIVE